MSQTRFVCRYFAESALQKMFASGTGEIPTNGPAHENFLSEHIGMIYFLANFNLARRARHAGSANGMHGHGGNGGRNRKGRGGCCGAPRHVVEDRLEAAPGRLGNDPGRDA
jgi:hypothetical protein